jgi:exoribonuclease R
MPTCTAAAVTKRTAGLHICCARNATSRPPGAPHLHQLCENLLPAPELKQERGSLQEVDAPPDATGCMPTGTIVSITERNWRARGYAGSFQASDNITQGRTASLLFAPVERKFPFIRVSTRQAHTLMDKRVIVVVDEWPADSPYPLGHYKHTLGTIGDQVTETEVLLLEFDVNTSPFSLAVHACVPPLPWSVSHHDTSAPFRKDLRGTVVCSVDPPGCKDIDDALHARELPNGNVEVGVHIADVTHFVHAGSAMDMEASLRSTTVYLVDRRIDMLPKALTEDICRCELVLLRAQAPEPLSVLKARMAASRDLGWVYAEHCGRTWGRAHIWLRCYRPRMRCYGCSLREGVDRLAFSVIWELTPDAEPVSVQFTKSIIKSRAALTYQAAQNRIVDKKDTDAVTTSLRLLMRIAKVLRKRRSAPSGEHAIQTAEQYTKKCAVLLDHVTPASLHSSTGSLFHCPSSPWCLFRSQRMTLVALLACLEKPRHSRYEAGALNLASPEVKIKLADEREANTAIDVKMYELLETNMMVEEMMLMANITVGTHIQGKYPSCAVLRRHEVPTPERLEPLLQVPLACIHTYFLPSPPLWPCEQAGLPTLLVSIAGSCRPCAGHLTNSATADPTPAALCVDDTPTHAFMAGSTPSVTNTYFTPLVDRKGSWHHD